MGNDRSNQDTDAKAILLMAVLLASVVTLLSFLLDDPSNDRPGVAPILSAQAAALPAARDETAPSAATTRRDEAWASDESSRGSRPDASH